MVFVLRQVRIVLVVPWHPSKTVSTASILLQSVLRKKDDDDDEVFEASDAEGAAEPGASERPETLPHDSGSLQTDGVGAKALFTSRCILNPKTYFPEIPKPVVLKFENLRSTTG